MLVVPPWVGNGYQTCVDVANVDISLKRTREMFLFLRFCRKASQSGAVWARDACGGGRRPSTGRRGAIGRGLPPADASEKQNQRMWALFPRAGRPGSVQAAHSAFVRAAGREPGGWRGSIPWKFISTPWKSISMGWKGRDKACKRRRKALKMVRKGEKRAVFRVNLSKTRLRGPLFGPRVSSGRDANSAPRGEIRLSFGTFRPETGWGGRFFTTKHNGAAGPRGKMAAFQLR